MNKTALSMLRYDEIEVIGHWYPKIIGAEDSLGKKLAPIGLPITKSLLEGKPVSQKLFYERKDKTILPVSVTVSPVLLEGRPIGAVEVFHDITQELEIDRAKAEFISLASHQLKTPPTALKWSLEILGDGSLGTLNEDQKNTVSEMANIANKMIQTVDALLNISRLDLGTFIVEPIPTNYVDVAKESIGELKSKITVKKINIEESYAPDIPSVPADPGLAKIILDNLIGNGVKYTPAGGKVSVKISLEKDEDNPAGFILIKVADSGVGIPKAEQDKIFAKMFRAGNVKDIEGTGLGLYIVKSIVELARGKIWFESKEGEGTTFYVSLSLAGMAKKEGTSKLVRLEG